ncbi:MAG TPA: hypothetical protein VFH08_16400 [Chitinophagaceae bacterium]|nr:hypothetical protein [Chitinophagaceae bacterium]
MNNLIYYVDISIIQKGKLDELKNAVQDLVEFVNLNESRPIAYNIYFNEDKTQMTLMQIHPDSASLELHLKIAGPAFQKFKHLIQLSTIQIYGNPTDDLLNQLRRKAQMLGNAKVVVHDFQTGFSRFPY